MERRENVRNRQRRRGDGRDVKWVRKLRKERVNNEKIGVEWVEG